MPADDVVDDDLDHELAGLRRSLDARLARAEPDAGAVLRRSRTVQQRHRAFVATTVVLAALLGVLVWAQGGPGRLESMTPAGRPQREPAISTISPLFHNDDTRNRLADEVQFTVRSPFRSFWRLTALDEFDGEVWQSLSRFSEAEVPADPPPNAAEITVEVRRLDALWAPHGGMPAGVRSSEVPLDFNAETGTFIPSEDVVDLRGRRYSLFAMAPPLFDPRRDGQDEVPTEVRATSTELPPLDPSIAEQARSITRDGTTPYGRAVRLEGHLASFDRAEPDERLEESLEHPVVRFLRTRRGHPEQFAGTFAVMARSIGLPARVVVGFTAGDEVEPGVYEVRGRHAHAWAEVHLGAAGWVPFEPTPGMSMPGR